MGIMDMTMGGLSFGYKVLGEDAQLTLPSASSATTPRVIFSVDGAAVLDGMVHSIGPSLRVRVSDAPSGVPRKSAFVLSSGSWHAREAGVLINDGQEIQVQLGVT